MIFSQADIESLNRTRKAISGTTYTATNGREFIGISGGRVILKPAAENVVFTPSVAINQNNVQTAVDSIEQSKPHQITFTGSINNINTTFVCSEVPDFWFLNGMLLTENVDYSILDKTITMFVAPADKDILRGQVL